MSQNIFNGIKAVLFDLNGTLFVDDQPLEGSLKALSHLKENTNIKKLFITNNSKESIPSLQLKLQKLGFDIDENSIFSSLTATKVYLKKTKARPYFILKEDAKSYFDDLKSEDPNSVVIGLPPNEFNFSNLNEAFNLVLNGAQLIAINKSRFYKTKGSLHIAAGSLVSALEYSTGVKCKVIGKPSKEFFDSALTFIGEKACNCVMIGDDYNDDVIGSMNAGMKAVLVKTGKYQKGDENKINCSGSFVTAENVLSAVSLIIDAKKS